MDWLTGYAMFHWVATWANPACDVFFRFVTDLGQPTFYYVTVAPLFWVVDRRQATVLFLLLLASVYVNEYAKLFFNTPRPDPALARVLDLRPYRVHSAAFPSGHAQGAVVFWGCLAWWVARPWFTKLAIVAVALISFSRLYLAVHFPIDIVGGLVLGVAMLPLIRPLDRWVARDCATPDWAIPAIVLATLAVAVTGNAALAMVSGSVVGFLAGAVWLPQQPLALSTRRQAAAVALCGLVLLLALAAVFTAFPPTALALIYLQVVLLWVFALWVYPRLVTALWLQPAPDVSSPS